MFGDSIGQGIILSEETGKYTRSRRGCIQLLRESGLRIETRAVMGCTVEKGLELFRGTDTEPGGICVIEFGGNDCDLDWQAVSDRPEEFHDGRVPLEDFRRALRIFVREAAERGLRPVLVTPPPILSRRYFDWVSRGKNPEHILRYLGDVEHISRWQERYANAVREAAHAEECELLDLRREWLNERNYPALMSLDGIHPNEEGYRVMTQYILRILPAGQVKKTS